MNQAPPGGPVPGSSKHTTGLLLIVLGLLFLGETHHGIFGWNFTFGRLWPLLLIVAGLARLMGPRETRISAEAHVARVMVEHRRPRRRSSGLGAGTWLIFLGFLFLLHTNGLLTLDRSWPLFIVWAGVTILFVHRFGGPPAEPPGTMPESPSAPVASPAPPISTTAPDPPAGTSQP